MGKYLNRVWAIVALAAVGASLWQLSAATDGLAVETVAIGHIPATIYRPAHGEAAPVVVIAHGFAGSRQLMQAFAVTFARNGYTAVTFDFAGHGRNPAPLTGSITEETGATRTLVGETARVAAYARGLGDGRLAVLGHSMASDIVVRFARQTPDVAATIAVSMFSPAVTRDSPRNLLVITGGWEGTLRREGLHAVGLVAPSPREGVTYGDPASESGRRAAFSPGTEHLSVLYSRDSLREAVAWLDASFGTDRADPPWLDRRGPWIMLLLAGCVLLARPLSRLLPVVSDPPAGASLGWRCLWLPLLLPAIATPLLLRVLPTHFLPVLVADYLACHFALYGVLTFACLVWLRRRTQSVPSLPVPSFTVRWSLLAAATAAVIFYGFVALVWPIDTYAAAFVPGAARLPLMLALLAGTLAYFTADEWMTGGAGAARGAYAVSKLAFLASLGLAVALDFERLFFLAIIVPVIVLFFVVYGLFSRWAGRRTGHPLVGGIANAVAFAWAIGVSFPLLAG